MSVTRIFVEKKKPYDIEAMGLLHELQDLVGITSLRALRLLNRYDVEGIGADLFAACRNVVFAEPQVDNTYDELPVFDGVIFAVEYLPGQFDQRADSCAECIQLISQGERPTVATAKVYLLEGALSGEEIARIQAYVINPVECREAALAPKETLAMAVSPVEPIPVLAGFCLLDRAGLQALVADYGLAMDVDDAAFCRDYFAQEGRDPTLTELRVIDTYWSDHCRHTTFGTVLDELVIQRADVQAAYDRYLQLRKTLGREDKPITLMDMATIGARYLKQTGALTDLDESEEINACSVRVEATVDGKREPWLLMFKNETHNHPTEIEPFGGAATCIGGAIRDPLSGRSYVFGAMRVTGAADPTVPVGKTMPGKLPQRKLVTTAAAGYSSYGNQIGLATGHVDELYHPGYVAKRMEIGAVLGAAPAQNVRREAPKAGDVIVLLGGRTGRDGIGGATGSSKAHKAESLATCGAEVQKGNAPVERKLQRLFRDPKTTKLIKRCNDFGAGGVSVAIGELAEGLVINLDAVPKKYEGLDGTELAISESQERMAVVLDKGDLDAFLQAAQNENLEATVVAAVTEAPRLVMEWQGQRVVDIARAFLDTNGAAKHAKALVPPVAGGKEKAAFSGQNLAERLRAMAADLNICSKKGLVERFDSTIGAGSVLLPFGGRWQATPAQAMAMKLPAQGEMNLCAGMAYGCDPFLLADDPYTGAYRAVEQSVCKLVAAGFRRAKMWLTFQEYFERLREEPSRWGKPVAALLGALDAQLNLKLAAIGGKDSMSGSFEHLDVPPTLCSFAVGVADCEHIISPELKKAGSTLVMLADMDEVEKLIAEKRIVSCWAAQAGGVAAGLFKMALGNRIGVKLAGNIDLFAPYDGFIAEVADGVECGTTIGKTVETFTFTVGEETVDLADILPVYEGKLEGVFPTRTEGMAAETVPDVPIQTGESILRAKAAYARPRALIPVFPGTNCEYDTAKALAAAGAEPEILVINNLTPGHIGESVARMEKAIGRSQIIVLPGGFSGGDEPDGSAKLIVSFFRNPRIAAAVTALLEQRDGLMLGICNGFQALIKLGLVPFGNIRETDANCPTLTYNRIGRHQSMMVETKIISNRSPWLQLAQPGEIHTVAMSHGEGRFVADNALLRQLAQNGQIATQYVDIQGRVTMEMPFNPNGSDWAIEGILSPDGRVLGKMGHSERVGRHLYRNVPGNTDQRIFESGVGYFR